MTRSDNTTKRTVTINEYEELREEAEKEALTQARVAYMLRNGDIDSNGNIIGFKPPI